jgi:hypothetical protein
LTPVVNRVGKIVYSISFVILQKAREK